MSWDDEEHSGIPTRAIHESYLEMQHALKQYRQAHDQQHQLAHAHGGLQESILTFYELLRPYLRDNQTVEKYWTGRPPSYNGNDPPDARDGFGVLHVQTRTDPVGLDGMQTDELSTLKDWHEALELNGRVRLQSVATHQAQALVQYEAYQLGLQHLDGWETEFVEREESMGGFMGDKSTTDVRQRRVDPPRLQRAARELSAAAKDMGFLSKIDTPTNDDPLPI